MYYKNRYNFLVILLVFYFLVFNDNYLFLFYRQYDVIANLIQINLGYGNLIIKFISKTFNINNEIILYKYYCYIIFCLNIFFLNLYLKNKNLSELYKLIILIIFACYPNFMLRMNYGHLTLLPYYQFFISLILIDLYIINKKIYYLYSTLLLSTLSFVIDIQYGIYNVILILIYLSYKNNLLELLKYFNKNFILFLNYIILSIVILYLLRKDQISIFLDTGRLFFDIDIINKYTIVNPFEIFLNFNLIYQSIINFKLFDLDKLTDIKDLNNFLLYYSPNGPEFTFFLGVPFIMMLILIYKKNKRIFCYFVIIFSIISLLCLNKNLNISLIYINNLLFPFIRSISRMFIILEVFSILVLIEYFSYYNTRYILNLLIILIFATQFYFYYLDRGVKYSEVDFQIDNINQINYPNIDYPEDRYLYDFLEIKNNQKFNSISNSLKISHIFNDKTMTNRINKIFYSN